MGCLRGQIEKARTQHDNSELQQRLEELVSAKAELEKRLQASESGFREALKALEKASSDPGGCICKYNFVCGPQPRSLWVDSRGVGVGMVSVSFLHVCLCWGFQ